jgi:hypothetical protein
MTHFLYRIFPAVNGKPDGGLMVKETAMVEEDRTPEMGWFWGFFATRPRVLLINQASGGTIPYGIQQ